MFAATGCVDEEASQRTFATDFTDFTDCRKVFRRFGVFQAKFQ